MVHSIKRLMSVLGVFIVFAIALSIQVQASSFVYNNPNIPKLLSPTITTTSSSSSSGGGSNPFDQNLNTTANVTHASLNITGKGLSNKENALTIGNCIVTAGSGTSACFEIGLQVNGSDDSNDIIDVGIFSKFIINAHEFRFFNASDNTPTGFLGQSFGEAQESCGNFACQSKAIYIYLSNQVSELRYYDYRLAFVGTVGTASRIEGIGTQSGTNSKGGPLYLSAGNCTGDCKNTTGYVVIQGIRRGQASGTANRSAENVSIWDPSLSLILSNLTIPSLQQSGSAYVCVNTTGGIYSNTVGCGLGP